MLKNEVKNYGFLCFLVKSESFTLITGISFEKCWLAASLLWNSSYDLLKSYCIRYQTLYQASDRPASSSKPLCKRDIFLPFCMDERHSAHYCLGPPTTSFFWVMVPGLIHPCSSSQKLSSPYRTHFLNQPRIVPKAVQSHGPS